MTRATPERDLRGNVDRFGNLSVHVRIGRRDYERETGANAKPSTIAQFLRDLADDVERLGAR